jgi:hypothetical protein
MRRGSANVQKNATIPHTTAHSATKFVVTTHLTKSDRSPIDLTPKLKKKPPFGGESREDQINFKIAPLVIAD